MRKRLGTRLERCHIQSGSIRFFYHYQMNQLLTAGRLLSVQSHLKLSHKRPLPSHKGHWVAQSFSCQLKVNQMGFQNGSASFRPEISATLAMIVEGQQKSFCHLVNISCDSVMGWCHCARKKCNRERGKNHLKCRSVSHVFFPSSSSRFFLHRLYFHRQQSGHYLCRAEAASLALEAL